MAKNISLSLVCRLLNIPERLKMRNHQIAPRRTQSDLSEMRLEKFKIIGSILMNWT